MLEWREEWTNEDYCEAELKYKDQFLKQFKAFVDCHRKLTSDQGKVEDY